jgi:hypothetical protein
MKLLLNMKKCKVHVMYPARFDKCPNCHSDAKSKPFSRPKVIKDEGVSLGDILSAKQIEEMEKVMEAERREKE